MSIEEISLVFDYGTKEGRQKALEQLHHQSVQDEKSRADGTGYEGYVGDEEQMGKERTEHVEVAGEKR